MFKLGVTLAAGLAVWGAFLGASPDDTKFRAVGALAAFMLFAPLRRVLWGSAGNETAGDARSAAGEPPPEPDELRVKD
jgi:hypothetical protein